MRNRLSGKYTFDAMARFAWPTVVMLVFMSLYTMVDGAFVSVLVGTDALSALNIVMPVINIYFAVGIMLATGTAAIVARKMGQGRGDEASGDFSFMLYVAAAMGVAISLAASAFLDPILRLLGARPEVFAYCRDYLGTLLLFVPLAILQMMFQSFFVVAGRPGVGLAVVVAGGLANVVLDYLFIAVLGLGVTGAALATGIGYAIPAVSGLVFFIAGKGGALILGRPRPDWRVLAESCFNGSSEMVSNLSLAVVTYLFNRTMLRLLGVDGVAAITIVLYAEFLLASIYMGFSTGVAPLFSYKYGKRDDAQLKKLFRNSLLFIGLCSVAAVTVSLVFAGPIVSVFTPTGSEVYDYALHGFRLHALCFIFMGFNIFASAMFTALANGKISALLSFLRTFFFLVLAITLLPGALGVDGVWLAVPVAEALSIFVSGLYVVRLRSVYRYV